MINPDLSLTPTYLKKRLTSAMVISKCKQKDKKIVLWTSLIENKKVINLEKAC